MTAFQSVPLTQPNRMKGAANGHATQSSESKKVRLKNAVFVEDFAHKVLVEMRETLSFSDSETARDNALALASAVKSWETASERVRILKGEPMPGARRPLPDQPKTAKKKLNRPPPKLGPKPSAPPETPQPVVKSPENPPSCATSGSKSDPAANL